MGFTMFARCFLDIMYLVLLLFNDNLLILSHSLIFDSSLLISDRETAAREQCAALEKMA